MVKKQILIVGGGFGGVKTALELCGDPRLDITLISDRGSFRYYPTLYHTATGGTRAQSSIPLGKIFENRPVKIVQAQAAKLDQAKRILTTNDKQNFTYDFLVLALGVVTNYFGIKGLEEYSFGIKSVEEAEELKAHLHKQLTDEHKPDLNYVIVGGGPTGIELAGALPAYLKHIMATHGIEQRTVHVDLVEAMPKLLPRLPAETSKNVTDQLHRLGIKLYLDQKVEGETADALMINGKALTSHTVIWTAGVTNNPFFSANGFQIADHGKVAVDQYLQAAPDIFVIGDNANTPYSGLAQTAIYDADFISGNLKRHLNGQQPKAYKPKKPITVIPAGHNWAAVVWGNAKFYGRLGWIIRQLADFVAFHDIESLLPASEQWMTEFASEESCPVCVQAAAKA